MAGSPLSVLRGLSAVVLRGRGRSFDSAGLRIRYFEAGAGDAVVLIHGFSRASSAWSASGFSADFARDHRVVTFDCRGHGRSGKPSGTVHYGRRMADDVIRLLDHLKLEAAHLVGHSMGGRITLRLAASRPDRVRSAVLIASGGTLASGAEADPMPVERVAVSLERGNGFGPLLEAVLPRDRALPRWQLKLLDLAASATNDPVALAAVARGYADLAVTDGELAAWSVPLATIVGSADPYRSAAAALARRVPAARMVLVEGATHLDIVRRAETRRAVREFFAACATGKRAAA
jgi:pimeloyl-ACP methyl ester carboxylesterase